MFLRPLNIERDKDALHALYSDPKCCEFLLNPATESLHDTVSILRTYDSEESDTSWVVVNDDDGPALGQVKMIPRGFDTFEAAIMLTPAAQGKGLAVEALAKALDIVFDEHGARRVYADIDPDNAPTIRLFEKLGFILEGRLRATYETHIGVRDSIIVSLLESDRKPWRS
ncbi:MAG: GNAT family N-acetyltransferase [Alphaproteobacteria bacterium]|nr:GNAT family N-acetyltransferase [Alphaproteobacteria bacterium]